MGEERSSAQSNPREVAVSRGHSPGSTRQNHLRPPSTPSSSCTHSLLRHLFCHKVDPNNNGWAPRSFPAKDKDVLTTPQRLLYIDDPLLHLYPIMVAASALAENVVDAEWSPILNADCAFARVRLFRAEASGYTVRVQHVRAVGCVLPSQPQGSSARVVVNWRHPSPSQVVRIARTFVEMSFWWIRSWVFDHESPRCFCPHFIEVCFGNSLKELPHRVISGDATQLNHGDEDGT